MDILWGIVAVLIIITLGAPLLCGLAHAIAAVLAMSDEDIR